MRYHDGAVVGEHFAAGDMITMVMAVNHIADGLVEPLGDLGLEPGGGIGIDGIGDDDAVRRDQVYRIMKIILKAV